MLAFLPSTLRGIIASTLLILNTLVMSVPLFLVAFLKLAVPVPAFRRTMGKAANTIAELWTTVNSGWMRLTQKLDFYVEGLEDLDRNGWYLVTANHQSWADIVIMQHLLNKKIPLMKFFLKKELIWVPVIGLCWWALDFPFMQRYAKAYLAKYPEKKGKDLAAARKACEKFKDMPVSIVNYLEGTRFSEAKHQNQKSPFKHLLKPKAGGISYVLGAMGYQVRSMVNITIRYNQSNLGFWDFLCGRIERASVHVEVLQIPQAFAGKDYQSDPVFREQFQQWVNALWVDKDNRLESMANHQTTSMKPARA